MQKVYTGRKNKNWRIGNELAKIWIKRSALKLDDDANLGNNVFGKAFTISKIMLRLFKSEWASSTKNFEL